jgi:hypothetical protein
MLEPGRYRLRLRLPDDTLATFDVPVAAPESRVRARAEQRRLRAAPGEPLTVRFDVTGARPAAPQLLAYSSAPGALRQVRVAARRVGGSAYVANLRLPEPGSYRLTLIAEEGLPAASQDLGAVVTVTSRTQG